MLKPLAPVTIQIANIGMEAMHILIGVNHKL